MFEDVGDDCALLWKTRHHEKRVFVKLAVQCLYFPKADRFYQLYLKVLHIFSQLPLIGLHSDIPLG